MPTAQTPQLPKEGAEALDAVPEEAYSCLPGSQPRRLEACATQCARKVHLQGSQHIGLEELLIGEGMVDQRAVVDDCVQALRQLLVHFWLQPQVRLCQVACVVVASGIAALACRHCKSKDFTSDEQLMLLPGLLHI